MIRGTIQHPKMHHFGELLNPEGTPDIARAAGTLTALWEFVSRYCPQGDIGKFTDHHIERHCYWTGLPGTLTSLLVASGWLDHDAAHRLLVHDWPDHCEDVVHIHLARKRLFFADGTPPKLSRLSPATERTEAEQWYIAHGCSATNVRNKRAQQRSATNVQNEDSLNPVRDDRDIAQQTCATNVRNKNARTNALTKPEPSTTLPPLLPPSDPNLLNPDNPGKVCGGGGVLAHLSEDQRRQLAEAQAALDRRRAAEAPGIPHAMQPAEATP